MYCSQVFDRSRLLLTRRKLYCRIYDLVSVVSQYLRVGHDRFSLHALTINKYHSCNYHASYHLSYYCEHVAGYGYPARNYRYFMVGLTWKCIASYIVRVSFLSLIYSQTKCHNYWTGKDTGGSALELELFTITLQEEDVYAFYTVRKIAVKNKQVLTARISVFI